MEVIIKFLNIVLVLFCLNANCEVATWYGPGFHGKRTASGEVFNQNALTAAHKKFKFGTKLKITNIKNGKSVIVKINDRGPFGKGKDLDLSKAAFSKIANLNQGVIKVKISKIN